MDQAVKREDVSFSIEFCASSKVERRCLQSDGCSNLRQHSSRFLSVTHFFSTIVEITKQIRSASLPVSSRFHFGGKRAIPTSLIVQNHYLNIIYQGSYRVLGHVSPPPDKCTQYLLQVTVINLYVEHVTFNSEKILKSTCNQYKINYLEKIFLIVKFLQAL